MLLASLSLDVHASFLSMVVPLLKPLLLSGYMIGYLVQSKNDKLAPDCPESEARVWSDDTIPSETGAAPLMSWNKVKDLLADRVTTADFERLFR